MTPGRTLLLLLLLLLSLVATVKTRIIPQSPVCPNSENNSFPQNVTVNLTIINQNTDLQKSSDYSSRSTSPWRLHRNADPERYPPVIWEAKCRHLGCITDRNEVDHSRNSVPIQQEILVLRRESQHCPHSFRLEKMLVTVGCTCVNPIVRYVG
ncbi:interleukin-17A [Carlito syrichta]|uniref:Interleukin-17A n=1 Tax=Carlito syrichta TaxID=1868482 RepID=A0A1U7TCT2_CARSF|nr:interleukin-17A [Carlito syrichta]